MTEVRTVPMWHVYGLEIPEGEPLAGCWMSICIGPTTQEMPLTWPRSKKGNDLAAVMAEEEKEPDALERALTGAPWLMSFDHLPSDEEMDELQERVLGPERAAESDH